MFRLYLAPFRPVIEHLHKSKYQVMPTLELGFWRYYCTCTDKMSHLKSSMADKWCRNPVSAMQTMLCLIFSLLLLMIISWNPCCFPGHWQNYRKVIPRRLVWLLNVMTSINRIYISITAEVKWSEESTCHSNSVGGTVMSLSFWFKFSFVD